MRATIAFGLGLLWLTVLAHAAHAYPAQVLAPTPLLLRVNGKVVNGPTIPKGRQIEVLATSPTGGFVQTDFAGKRGWISAKNVHALGGNRAVASGGSSHATAGNSEGMVDVSSSLGLQGSGGGLGFGVAGMFNTPWTTGQWRWEAGPAFYYFPSAGESAFTGYSITMYELMGVVRGLYQFNPTMEVGGELGLIYMKANYPSTLTGVTSTSSSIADSWIGLTMGGVYRWRFAHDWRLLSSLRFLVANGSTYLMSGGVEYRF